MSSQSIAAETLLMQNPDVILREHEPGGPILFNPDNDDMRLLNPTGLLIWKLLGHPIRFADLLEKVVNEFDHPHIDEMRSDLTRFIDEMIRQGYIGLLC